MQQYIETTTFVPVGQHFMEEGIIQCSFIWNYLSCRNICYIVCPAIFSLSRPCLRIL